MQQASCRTLSPRTLWRRLAALLKLQELLLCRDAAAFGQSVGLGVYLCGAVNG